MGIFEDLVAEGAAVPLEGWDFSWFSGRATEERPPWGYASLIAARLAAVKSALDLQTGGGEVTASAPVKPALLAATESWPPNARVAARNLPGAVVVQAPDDGPLPFCSSTFDLVISRHPVVTPWAEVARVLKPGGTYFSQQIGAGTNRELTDFMMGPQPVSDARSTERARADAVAAGLEVLRLESVALRVAFFDVGAVVHFLRKVLWTVPGFTVEAYRDRLLEMHEHIQEHGEFVSTSTRFLIEARKP
ncbi:methyltransferase domain-containing protein [Lentzea flava]|uniref:Methyltransferase type 11 n=1 Tax=Lentzea flava TaxID=103732 RepID=A0ABQ2UJX1_9PSEU|nr:methyltransferase domain-containing protein [Lentzea flava]MCP2200241.1 Methyltransferase domain-containing protein [Lentzea flava]GGU40919.1 methyltransferase type 11 [Lentzea flava]